MMNKKGLAILAIVVVILVAMGIWYYEARQSSTLSPSITSSTTTSPTSSAGSTNPPTTTPTGVSITGTPVPATLFAANNSVESGIEAPLNLGFFGHPSTLAWPWIEQQPNVYTWTYFDKIVNAAPKDANGVALIDITLGETPMWELGNNTSSCSITDVAAGIYQCTAPPVNIQDWTNFIQALVNHYNGVTAPHVKYYEIWNEWNYPNFWTGTVAQMIALGQAAYPIIHQDPYSMVLTPSTTGPARSATDSGPAAIAAYLQGGGPADAGSFHGYTGESLTPAVSPYPMPEQDSTSGCTTTGTLPSCYGSIITKVTTYRAVFNANGLAGKPMFDTEGGWGKNANITDPDMQAAWVARWYALQAGLSAEDNLQEASWYAWDQPSPTAGWGYIGDNASGVNEAGVAYQHINSWLSGAVVSPCTANGTVWSCVVTRANGYQGLLVWDTAQSCSNGTCTTSSYSTASTPYTQALDLAGDPAATISGNTVSIGAKPVMLQNKGFNK